MEKKSYRKHHDKHGKRHIEGKYASSDGNVDTKAEKFIARKKFELSNDVSDNDDHPSMHMMKAERYTTPPQYGYHHNFDKVISFDTSAHGYARHNHKLDEFTRSYPGYDHKFDIDARGYARYSHSYEKTARGRTVYDHNFNKMTHGFAGYDHNLEQSVHSYAGYDHNSENSMHGYTNYDLFEKVKHGREGYYGQYRSNPHNRTHRHHDLWNGGNDYYASGDNHRIFPSGTQVEWHASQFFKRFEDMGFNRGF